MDTDQSAKGNRISGRRAWGLVVGRPPVSIRFCFFRPQGGVSSDVLALQCNEFEIDVVVCGFCDIDLGMAMAGKESSDRDRSMLS